MKIYIAGPMRGHEDNNIPAFDKAAEMLRDKGHEVFNPADADRHAGLDVTEPFTEEWWAEHKYEVVTRDIHMLLECDTIYMLRGWEKSRGATAEHAVANWYGLKVWYQEGTKLYPNENEDLEWMARRWLEQFNKETEELDNAPH